MNKKQTLKQQLIDIQERIAIATALLERLEDWGLREDNMLPATREMRIARIISDTQSFLHDKRAT